jgi:hypothetical protein
MRIDFRVLTPGRVVICCHHLGMLVVGNCMEIRFDNQHSVKDYMIIDIIGIHNLNDY